MEQTAHEKTTPKAAVAAAPAAVVPEQKNGKQAAVDVGPPGPKADFGNQRWDLRVEDVDQDELVTRTWLKGCQVGLLALLKFMETSGSHGTANILFLIHNKLQVIFREQCNIHDAAHQQQFTDIASTVQEEFAAIVSHFVEMPDTPYPTKPTLESSSRIDMLCEYTGTHLSDFTLLCDSRYPASYRNYAAHLKPMFELQIASGQLPAAAFSVYLLLKMNAVINIQPPPDKQQAADTHLLVFEHMSQVVDAMTQKPLACAGLIAEGKNCNTHSQLIRNRRAEQSAAVRASRAATPPTPPNSSRRRSAAIPDPENPAGKTALSTCSVQ